MKIIGPIFLLFTLSLFGLGRKSDNLLLRGRVPASVQIEQKSFENSTDTDFKITINASSEKYQIIEKKEKQFHYIDIIFH